MLRLAGRLACVTALVCTCSFPITLFAQAVRQAKVQITVVDPSSAVVPDATVTVVGLEPATQAAPLPPVKTTDKGVAIVDAVAPGRYSISAEFPGFELGLLRDVRVRAGDNKHVVVLPLAKIGGQRHGRTRYAGDSRRPPHVRVRLEVDAGADRGAVRRSGRARPSARGAGRP